MKNESEKMKNKKKSKETENRINFLRKSQICENMKKKRHIPPFPNLLKSNAHFILRLFSFILFAVSYHFRTFVRFVVYSLIFSFLPISMEWKVVFFSLFIRRLVIFSRKPKIENLLKLQQTKSWTTINSIKEHTKSKIPQFSFSIIKCFFFLSFEIRIKFMY